ncbi:VOC family protein [Lichenicoccus sp.]|uniref:VOC family protein n=1 Tax=Lichenicoccus sp. TaxID=2781899 RepID=UPI003D12949C
MPDVFRLVYVDLATASLEKAEDYYTDVLGASIVAKTGRETYLSLGLDHHNVSLCAEPNPGLNAIGLQLCRDVPLADLAKRLKDSGVANHLRTDSRPGVPALLEIPDVGGHTIHLFAAIDQPAPGFSASGIVPLRLGHVALLAQRADELLSFLTNMLKFRKTDWIGDPVTFLTCNRDHHVLNVVQAPVTGLHHIAFELRGLEHHVQAMDRLAAEKRPILWGPSRHHAGHNLATYHHGPDNLLIEFYSEMDVFIPDLDSFEPRPWHDDLPQRPKHWRIEQMTAWETQYEFDFLTVSWGVRVPSTTNAAL